MPDTTAPDAASTPGARRLRRRVYVRRWIGLLALVLLVILLPLGVWLGLGLRSAAGSIQADASAAQTSIEAAKTQLEAGDYAAASASATAAQERVSQAADAAKATPVRLVGRLPVVGAAVQDLDHLIAAATDLANATSRIVVVYGAATGKAATGPKLFGGGHVNFGVLDRTTAAVDEALTEIADAQGNLGAVQGTLPGTHSMAAARDKALAQVEPLVGTLTTMKQVLARVPDAVGKGGVKRYLLVTLNPAELYPGGGAALSAALVQFKNGVFSVPIKGSVSTKLFPGNPRVVYPHVVGLPYFNPGGGAAFAWSDVYPDFNATAVEMERSWVANGMKPVDGVITMDPTALSAALRVTGPVASPVYGQINADNLVQKLLVDGYADFATNQDARHALNEQLMNAVFGRLTGGGGAMQLLKALASTAPGLHFRVHVEDPLLQRQVAVAGLAGALPTRPGDLLAAFTENQNGSKVDIFQKRTVTHDVAVAADGSATVTTTLTAHYDVPKSGRNPSDRVGYLTDWSYNWYLAHIPKGGTPLSWTAPVTDPGDRNDHVVYPDRFGRSVVRVGRWTAAGGSTTVTFRYSFPAGTFLAGSVVRYQLTTVPQPLTQDATVTISVHGPGVAAVTSDLPGWSVAGGVARMSGTFGQVASTSIEWH